MKRDTNKTPNSQICYLCGDILCEPISVDHVPLKQLYAHEIRRKDNPSKMLTIPVHDCCNKKYQHDEDYFVNTLAPFARGSYAGDIKLKEIVDSYHRGKNKDLVQKVLKEFDARPSGIILPKGKMANRFEGARMSRVALKILRGLYFHHHQKCLPEDLLSKVEIHSPDFPPPEIFYMALQNSVEQGVYPGVFDYKFATFPNLHNLHYWGFLLWDRIIITIIFQDPICGCSECRKNPEINNIVTATS